MIKNFKSNLLKDMWITGNTSLLPVTYSYEVADILTWIDSAEAIEDIELLGGFQVVEYQPSIHAVTITVNNVEPIGSVTFLYEDSNAYDVDLNEYPA